METMEFVQTYETTISDTTGQHSATVLVIPARSLGRELLDLNELGLEEVASEILGGVTASSSKSLGFDNISALYEVLSERALTDPEIDQKWYQFAVYVFNARIIPFEGSPLSAESLASIATGAVRAGTITLGVKIGFFAADGHAPLLLITVPLGIVLCGASVSFAKWLEENRKQIWNRLLARFEQESKKKKEPIREGLLENGRLNERDEIVDQEVTERLGEGVSSSELLDDLTLANRITERTRRELGSTLGPAVMRPAITRALKRRKLEVR